ncbi:glycoside hydrolase family 9 protein [Pedobacter puniceum]|nr:glycoside hydrolase family 9 protein [Pedobacter puniceum]
MKVNAATFTVSNTDDTGAGSLRQAITDANATVGPHTINFSIPSGSIINLTSGVLPTINVNIVFEAPAGRITVTRNSVTNFRIFAISASRTVVIKNLVISNGFSTSEGGAIENLGNLSIYNSIIENNTTSGSGVHAGAIANRDNAALYLYNCVLRNNTSLGGIGGAIISRTGAILRIYNSLLENNSCGGASGGTTSSTGGGAIDHRPGSLITGNLIVGTIVRNNTSTNQGGAINHVSGTLTILNSTISGNRTVSSGGRGGGICNQTGSSLIVRNSTISGNTATDSGGGVFSQATVNNLEFSNVTISGNTSATNGGGIGGTVTNAILNNCTITGNSVTSTTGAGGGVRVNGGNMEINYTIIKGNTSNHATAGANEADLNGNRFSRFGRNIIASATNPPIGSWITIPGTSTPSVTTGNIVTDANISTILNPVLATNDASTLTHALLVNSIAIDPATASGYTSIYDQRGFVRNGAIDIGAFEYNAPIASLTTNAVTDIRTATALFNASLNTGNLSSKVSFDYGLSTDYGLETITFTSTGGSVSISANTASLTPNTLYNVRAKAVYGLNDEFILYGANQTFTTPSINLAPVLTIADADLLIYTSLASDILIDNSLTITDADNTTLVGATVQITENSKSDEDEFSFTPVAGITTSFNANASGGALLTLSGVASLADYQTLLRSLKYVNSKGTNATYSARRILIKVDDGLNFSSDSRRIDLSFSENSPLLRNIENTPLAYSEDVGLQNITATMALSDPNSTDMTGGTIQIGNFISGEDALAFTDQNGITGSFNTSNGVLTLTGTSSITNYETALRSVRYVNNSGNPSTIVRTISFQVTDGTYNSNTIVRNIAITTINDAPVLAGIESTGLTHQEKSVAVNISSNIVLTDVDNTTITSATITVSNNYKNGQDILSFANTNSISSSWIPATGTLILTGNASLAEYQTALRNVKYYQGSNYDFSGLERTISFTVNDGALNSSSISRTITPTQKTVINFNYAEALQKSLFFYEVQRSGALPSVRGNLPGQNRVEWRGDALLNDGSDVGRDLTGGWHDAGDTYKCAATMAYAASFLAWSGLEYSTVYSTTNQTGYLLDNLKFINDYFIKCFTNDQPGTYEFYSQVTDGNFAHNHFAAPELLDFMFAPGANKSYKIDVTCKGSDIAGQVAATLASSSIVFRNAGDTNYANLLLDKARKMFDFGDAYRGVDGHRNAVGVVTTTENYFYRSSHYFDEMMWGAIWLHKAELAASTNGYTDNYLNKANEYYNLSPSPETNYAHFSELFFGNLAPAAFTLLVKETTGTTQTTYRRRVERWLDWWTIGYTDKVKYTPGGLATKTEDATRTVFAPLRYSTNQAFVAGIYSDWMIDGTGVDGATAPSASPAINTTINRKNIYDSFAQSQIRYVLGDNPYNRSYVIGMGPNPWNAPHHRAALGGWAGFEHLTVGKPQYNVTQPRHILYGALMGGPGTAENGNPLDFFDLSVNNIATFRTNEVALDFNAGLPGAFARMYVRNPGNGSQLANFPTPEVRDDEIFTEAQINSQSATSISIKAQVNNRTAWPARVTDKLSTRYYFTLDPSINVSSLVVTQGTVTPNTNTEGGTISPITHFSGDIYYVKVDFTGRKIFPGGVIGGVSLNNVYWMREANFTITGPSGWNNSNDWSFNGLSPLSTSVPTKTQQMPVYDNDVLIYGVEPALVLPVALKSYEAKAEGSRTKLEWITVSETDNDYFIVERSTDGVNYTLLTRVKSVNNNGNSYTVYDNNPFSGNNYYRLTQVDKDGKMEELGIRTVNFKLESTIKLTVFPNPTSDVVNFSIHNYEGNEVELSLYDITGRLIHSEKVNRQNGLKQTMQMKEKPVAGQYMLHFKGKNLNEVKKLVIM